MSHTVSFAFFGAMAFGVMYLVARGLRALIAWSQRESGPKERVEFYLPLLCAVGAVVGLLIYPQYVAVQECQNTDKPMVQCLLFEAPKSQ